jgi:hypothetical protein
MTLRAYLITVRGRIREALCPELQALRDQNRSLRADCRQIVAQRDYWMARAEKAEAQRDELRAKVESLRNALEAALDRIPHQCEGLDYAEADCPACQVKALAEEPTK